MEGASVIERRIIVVEDDPFTGALLSDSLELHGFTVERAQSALAARKVIQRFDPDVALIDIDLGQGPSGLDLLAYLEQARPEIAPILLTQRATASGLDALPSGVAFLNKGLVANTEYLIEAIEETVRGRGANIRHQVPAGLILATLTDTQREIMRLIALGYTNTEIARLRGVTVSGAEQSIRSLYRALGLDDDAVSPRVEATRLYIRAEGVPDRSEQ